jgi:hypothetical protein
VLPAAARAHAGVRELVEMRADDVALASLSGTTLRRTLRLLEPPRPLLLPAL